MTPPRSKHADPTPREDLTMTFRTTFACLLATAAVGGLPSAAHATASCSMFSNPSGIGGQWQGPYDHGRANCAEAGYESAWGVPLFASYRIVEGDWETMHDPFWVTEPVMTLIASGSKTQNLCNQTSGGRTTFSGNFALTDSITVGTSTSWGVGVQANLNDLFAALPAPALTVKADFSAATTNSSTDSTTWSFGSADQVNTTACAYTVADFELSAHSAGVARTSVHKEWNYQFKCYLEAGLFAFATTDWLDDMVSPGACDFQLQDVTATMPKMQMSTTDLMVNAQEYTCGSGDVIDDGGTPADPTDDTVIPELGPACAASVPGTELADPATMGEIDDESYELGETGDDYESPGD